MPTVPRYTQQVSDAPLPGVRVSTDAPIEAFGGGKAVAQANEAGIRLIDTARQIAIEEKRKADDVVTTKAYTELLNRKNNLMYNPKDGVVTKKNEAAFGVVPEYSERFNKEADDIESSLYNGEQRAAFKQMRKREGSEFNQGLLRYETGERQKFDDINTKNMVDAAQNNAALNWAMPGVIEKSLMAQEAAITAHSERNGLPADVNEQRVLQAKSSTTVGVIQNMMAGGGNDISANNYYKHASKMGWLTAEDDTKIQGWLQTSTTRAEGQRFSDNLIQQGKSYSEGLAEIHKIQDPEKRQSARNNFLQYQGDIERANDIQNKKNFDSAFKRAAEFNDPDFVPAPIWASLDPEQQKAIESYTKLKRDGVKIITNPIEKQLFISRLANPATRNEAAKENLLLKADQFSQGDMKYLQELQDDVNKNDEKAVKELNSYLSSNVMARATLTSSGIDVTPKDEDSANKLHLFMDAYTKKADLFYEQNGKYPNDEQKQAIMDDLTLNVEQHGWLIDPNKKRFEVEAGKKIKYADVEIPDDIADAIAAGLRKRGLKVTPEAIAERYLSAQKK